MLEGKGAFFRRCHQLYQLLVSPQLTHDYESGFKERYQDPVEVQHHSKIVSYGLYSDERAALLQSFPKGSSLLVVGCGAGRESIDLWKQGFKVTGLDLSSAMIQAANSLLPASSRGIRFVCSDLFEFKTDHSFDGVFISAGVLGHIKGFQNRVLFLKRAAHFLKKEGYLIYAPDIFPFKRMSLYQWASFLLKWRWKLNGLEWEKGDTARSFLGPHNIEKKLFYFHFYQDKDSFLKEVDHAGLEVKEIIEDHWILTFRDK